MGYWCRVYVCDDYNYRARGIASCFSLHLSFLFIYPCSNFICFNTTAEREVRQGGESKHGSEQTHEGEQRAARHGRRKQVHVVCFVCCVCDCTVVVVLL